MIKIIKGGIIFIFDLIYNKFEKWSLIVVNIKNPYPHF